jgi:serine/threonine-protein kinase
MTTPADGSERSSPPAGPEALVGVTLSGRYLIERVLGEGGMGAVYQAEHTLMRKRMAVKVLHPEMSRMPEVVARFEREAMAAAHIDHPNVAAATDFGKLDDGSFFLVLEFVEGKSLREAMGGSRLELGRAIHVARQIASALARAHGLGIVHRDLKPENVMLVSRDGDPDFVKVLDFGIAKVPVGEIVGEAKAPGQVLTQLGMVYGTPEYMAPEQALGQPVDPRADLYALGVMMFEMIVGARPYDNSSKVALLGMHVTAPIPSMAERAPEAEVPAEVDAIVRRLLAKEAGARFVDARELVETLDAVTFKLVGEGRIAEPVGPHSLARASDAGRHQDGTSPAPPGRGRYRGGSNPDRSGPSLAIGVAPTGLAHPRVSAPSRVAANVRSSLERALRSAPPWLTPRIAAIGGSSVALLLVVLLVSLVASGSHDRKGVKPRASASGSAAGTSQDGPASPPDPKLDQALAQAQSEVERGNFASAIDALTPIEKESPGRAEVHALLERAYMGAHDAHDALREAGLWLAMDPTASGDAKLREDVRSAAFARDTQDETFALLESQMGSEGAELLYDMAYGAPSKLYAQAAARARRSLDLPEVREHTAPALRVLMDMRDAKTCEQKKAILPDARDHGDARMIPLLTPLESARGCGFFGHGDCHPCLHKDHALSETIQAIKARAGGS